MKVPGAALTATGMVLTAAADSDAINYILEVKIMCCSSCKVPVFFRNAVHRERKPLWDMEKRPENDVPRDMYGRPLKTAAVKCGFVKRKK
jgi:hypothetical protein